MPTPEPTTGVIVEPVLAPDHPAPETVQVYETGTPVDVVVNTLVDEPTQTGAGGTITSVGMADGVMVKVNAVPAPQVSLAETEITASPVPVARLIELVVLDPVHPVPVYDQR